ncbi:ankyrin repeat-containing domain protein [Mycena metata]|uniref:Ankyrin repeat-containing domain protein n=1 Tax=Mycena metata TaxID=1033252 RepID=A0AAD7DMQ3_9AGAR|nr:ankyrin repeat-containing domain protein [Mycena metata]
MLQPNLADRNGRTPLMYSATSNSYPDVSNLLLNRPETDVRLTSNDGRTLLMHAASGGSTDLMHPERGHKAAVELLLARRDLNINSRDRHFRTPLYHALASAKIGMAYRRRSAQETADALRQHGAIADDPDLLERLESEACEEVWQWLHG